MDEDYIDLLQVFAFIVMICTFVLYSINIDCHMDRKKAESILDSPMLFLTGLSDGSDIMAGFLPAIIMRVNTKYSDEEIDKMIHDKGREYCFSETYNLKCFASMDCHFYLFRSIHSHITYYVEFDKGIINWLFYIAGWAVAIISYLFLVGMALLVIPSLCAADKFNGRWVTRRDREPYITYCIRCIICFIVFVFMLLWLMLFSPAILFAFYISPILFIILGIIGIIYCWFEERSKGGGD